MNSIQIRGRKITWQEQGEGRPILFGHSYLWDSNMWAPQLSELSKSYRCIAPDLWAHGQSDLPPDGSISIKAMAGDMLAFADALELDTFSVVGLSVGGMWGCQLALDTPERVQSLIIMDSYVGPEPEIPQKKFFGMLDQVEQFNQIPPPMQEAIVPFFFSPVTQEEQPGMIVEFRQQLSAFAPEQVPAVVNIGREIFGRQSLLDRLPELQMPTLIIVGEDDTSRPPHESKDMHQRIPGSELHIIPRAGHISSLEQPAVVNGHLEDFLSRV